VRPTAVRAAFWLLLSSSSSLFATTAHAAAIGAFLGLDRFGMWGDVGQYKEVTAQVQPLAGLQGEIGLSRSIALSLQPTYVRQETKGTTVSRPANTDYKLTLDSYSVPVVVKFGLGGGRTYVSSGLDFRFVSSAKLSGTSSEEDVKSSFHDVNLAALLGFGVVFPIGRPQLTTELRFARDRTTE
jgi:hypothetical protein